MKDKEDAASSYIIEQVFVAGHIQKLHLYLTSTSDFCNDTDQRPIILPNIFVLRVQQHEQGVTSTSDHGHFCYYLYLKYHEGNL